MVDETILSLDAMLDAPDLEYRVVPVPEWHGSVRLGSLDAGTMIAFLEKPATEPAGLWLLVQALVDADGTRIGTPAAVEAMKRKNKTVVNRLIGIVLEMNDLQMKPGAAKNGSGDAEPAAPPIA